MSNYTANVKYWLSFDNSKEKIHHDTLCFSAIVRKHSPYSTFHIKDVKSISYKCILPPADGEYALSREIQGFYIDFLMELSKKIKYDFQFRFLKDGNILFKFKLKNNLRDNPIRILLILTLHRYLQEFPEILIDFYKNKKNSLEENFIQFQDSHNNTLHGCKYYDNRYGHSIVKGNYKHTPLSLEKIKFNIKKYSIQDYFI